MKKTETFGEECKRAWKNIYPTQDINGIKELPIQKKDK